MKHSNIFMHGIPISISLNPTLEKENIRPVIAKHKKRLFIISSLSFTISLIVSLIAKLLVYLINLITNIFFHGTFSVAFFSPVHHSLGWFVIFIPVIGGFIVGLRAVYGSKAISELSEDKINFFLFRNPYLEQWKFNTCLNLCIWKKHLWWKLKKK